MSSQDIPSYASNKYRNTVELLERAKSLKDGVEKKGIDLGHLEGRRFKESYMALHMKEQVLGYLEDLTKGRVHDRELDKETLMTYTDWLLSDSPETPFPQKKQPSAYARAQWLKSYIHHSDDEGKAKRDILRSIYLESRPEVKLDEIENLVLAGGGAKALSLSGVIRSLEERGRSEQIKRVAGTSGGAIIAMAYAAGYSAEDLEKLVQENEFGLFTLGSNFDNGILNQWAHHFSNGSEKSKDKLHVLSDNSLAHTYHTQLMVALGEHLSKTDSVIFKNIRASLATVSPDKYGSHLIKILEAQPNKDVFYHSIIKKIPIDDQIAIDNKAKSATVKKMDGLLSVIDGVSLYKSPAAALVGAMRHKTGQDLVRGFFSDLIYDKLKTFPKEDLKEALYGKRFRDDPAKVLQDADVRGITFEQWQSLHTLMPEKVKELHISMSILKPLFKQMNGPKYDPYEHQSASFEHAVFKNMPVADAVRVSMNLPPIYKRYKFTVDGKKYQGSDGGIKSNMSLETFDQQYDPEKTIGVFYKTSSQLEAAVDVNRMLVIPRSQTEVSHDLKLLKVAETETEHLIATAKEMLETLTNEGEPQEKLDKIGERLSELRTERRMIGGRMSGANKELESILNSSEGPVKKWFKNPLSQFGHLFNRYIDQKSMDDLGRSRNLRRLVMINTHDIDTWHFKMNSSDKTMQMQYGKNAMGSLLNGTYCLENHFYHHYLDTVTSSLISHNIDLYLEEALKEDIEIPFSVNEISMTQEEIDGHQRTFEEPESGAFPHKVDEATISPYRLK